jgi:hypothetical protein
MRTLPALILAVALALPGCSGGVKEPRLDETSEASFQQSRMLVEAALSPEDRFDFGTAIVYAWACKKNLTGYTGHEVAKWKRDGCPGPEMKKFLESP